MTGILYNCMNKQVHRFSIKVDIKCMQMHVLCHGVDDSFLTLYGLVSDTVVEKFLQLFSAAFDLKISLSCEFSISKRTRKVPELLQGQDTQSKMSEVMKLQVFHSTIQV